MLITLKRDGNIAKLFKKTLENKRRRAKQTGRNYLIYAKRDVIWLEMHNRTWLLW